MRSSYDMACKTFTILEECVKNGEWTVALDLIETFKRLRQRLIDADETETVPGNMVLRGIKVVRDEYLRLDQKIDPEADDGSLGMMIAIDAEVDVDYKRPVEELKEGILGYFEEWKSEMAESAENIAKESLKHIIDDETIMTLGRSKTVEIFLKTAAKKRRFEVIVAECAPFRHGHEMARGLSESGIRTTVIPDSSMFALLPRVAKVIIGTHSVLANGGVKAVSGAYTLAESARHFSVPLIVLAAIFKYTPQYLVSHDQITFNKNASPQDILSFERGDLVGKVEPLNPVFDYVPPELVTVLIAGQNEGHSPSYVYHKLNTVCHRKDYSPDVHA